MKASNNLFSGEIFLLQSFLIKSAIHLRRSVPNVFDAKICLQSSASKPERPQPPLLVDATLNNISS